MVQTAAVLIALLLVLIALKDKAHALGAWLVILMSNGVFVHFVGADSGNLGLSVGLVLVPFLLMNRAGFYVNWLALFLLALFLSVGALSGILGSAEFFSITHIAKHAKPILLCLLIAGAIEDRRSFSVIGAYLIAAGVLGALFNIYQYLSGDLLVSSWEESKIRAAGLRGDPNGTAMLLLATLPMAYVRLIDSQSVNTRMLALVSLLIIAVGVISTQSRAGFLVTGILAILLIFHEGRAGRERLFGLPGPKRLGLAALLVVSAALLAPAAYWERMDTLRTFEEKGNSLAGRQALLVKGFEVWLNNPLLGIGPGRLDRLYVSMEDINVDPNAERKAAHNMYIDLLAGYGVIGTAAVFGVFVIAMVRLLGLDAVTITAAGGSSHVGFGFALGLLGMLLMGFTLSQSHNFLLWYFVGLGLAAMRWAQPEKPCPQEPWPGVGRTDSS